MIQKTLLKIFLAFYWLGIPLAVVVALSDKVAQFSYVEINLPDVSAYLLAFSLGHMVILVALGFMLLSPFHTLAGDKIQTAGYLHTLIGFTAALVRLDPDSFNLISILVPLASALMTSIIGWFLGGEIESRFASATPDPIRLGAEKLTAEFENFASAVRHVHEEYVQIIQQASEDYEGLKAKQSQIVAESTQIADQLNQTFKTISQSAARVETDISKLAQELSGVAESARNVAKYLHESRTLITELERLLALINEERSK